MSTTPDAPPRRRWYLPIVCAVVAVVGLTLAPILVWADLLPAFQMMIAHAGLIATAAAFVTAVVWFFALAGFSRRLRLWAILAAMGLIVLAPALVPEVDFTGDMRPIPRFRWQPSAQQTFDRSRSVEGSDLPQPASEGVDLTVILDRDSPRFRGPNGDGVLTPKELFATDWEKSPPKVLWRRPCGGGFSGFAVAGGGAVTLEQRRGDEALVCYDRDSGDENWAFSYAAHFRDVFGDGPRGTPAIHNGRVYSLGATGKLACVKGDDGTEVWSADVLNAGRPTTWGTSGSPLVVPDLGVVIVAPGGRAGPSVAAYDLDTGSLKWKGGVPGGGYSSPQEATLAGKRQVLIFDGGGLAGFDITDGEELWRHPWRTFQDMNITQPTVLNESGVFLSSEASNGCALLQVSRTKDGFAASVVWENKNLASKFSNPVALGGAIYGLSHGTIVCLDARTGKRHWRGKNYGHGQVLAAGGTIIVLSERGAVALVKADTRAFTQLAFLRVFDEKTWNTPALAGRRLFIRNAREMACVELPARE